MSPYASPCWRIGAVLGVCLLVAACLPAAGAEAGEAEDRPWYRAIDARWGGHLRVIGTLSWPHEDSLLALEGSGAGYDGQAELRLRNTLWLSNWADLETHYELVWRGGDLRRNTRRVSRRLPGADTPVPAEDGDLEDTRRFLDLSKTVHASDSAVCYHRLDRLALTLQGRNISVRIGRQVLTWGNGRLFNPMDLFNPFAPTDFNRDYKIGDDMVTATATMDSGDEFQLLYLPRRDPDSRRIEEDEASAAAKWHHSFGATEVDLMAAHHYGDNVFAAGARGNLAYAAWRLDFTWTQLSQDRDRQGFASLVANLDYSWSWQGKNWYGLVEYYYCGLAGKKPRATLADPFARERLQRGELFALGRHYAGAELQVELHPLLNAHVTAIGDLGGPSAVVQPRLVWDAATDVQLLAGAALHLGGPETEFGGFRIPAAEASVQPADGVFVWLTYYF